LSELSEDCNILDAIVDATFLLDEGKLHVLLLEVFPLTTFHGCTFTCTVVS